MDMAPAIQGAGDELIVGYTPSFRTSTGWRHTFRQTRPAPDGGIIRRVTFDNVDDPHRRVLVDVAEYPGPAEAVKKLEDARKAANFKTTAAPSRFGPGSFAFPETDARSLYFSRFNLMIWIYSCGREPVYVSPWAEQILTDLEAQHTTEPGSDLVLAAGNTPAASSPSIQIAVTSKWDFGEWAWRKFKATGGTLTRSMENDTVLFRPTAGSMEGTVTGWAIEPGRPTYAGRYAPPRRSA